MTELLL